MVSAGIVDLTLTQNHLAETWQQALPDLRISHAVSMPGTGGPGWLARKNNPVLTRTLNRFVKKHKKGTRPGNIYFNKYFKSTRWISNLLDSAAQRRLYRYMPLFRKYGEKYGLDWRLLAAVAYQESRLNPRCRSSRGAVGLMQVLPSTARDHRIGPIPILPKYMRVQNTWPFCGTIIFHPGAFPRRPGCVLSLRPTMPGRQEYAGSAAWQEGWGMMSTAGFITVNARPCRSRPRKPFDMSAI